MLGFQGRRGVPQLWDPSQAPQCPIATEQLSQGVAPGSHIQAPWTLNLREDSTVTPASSPAPRFLCHCPHCQISFPWSNPQSKPWRQQAGAARGWTGRWDVWVPVPSLGNTLSTSFLLSGPQFVCVCAQLLSHARLFATLPGSSVHGIFQVRILQ